MTQATDNNPLLPVRGGYRPHFNTQPNAELECLKCGVSSGLHRHHVVAWQDGGSDDPENLVWLCEPCHEEWHRVEFTTEGGFTAWLQKPSAAFTVYVLHNAYHELPYLEELWALWKRHNREKFNEEAARADEENRERFLKRHPSGYIGVVEEASGRFSASLQYRPEGNRDFEKLRLGRFDTAQDAARARDAAAIKHHINPKLNFPEEVTR